MKWILLPPKNKQQKLEIHLWLRNNVNLHHKLNIAKSNKKEITQKRAYFSRQCERGANWSPRAEIGLKINTANLIYGPKILWFWVKLLFKIVVDQKHKIFVCWDWFGCYGGVSVSRIFYGAKYFGALISCVLETFRR